MQTVLSQVTRLYFTNLLPLARRLSLYLLINELHLIRFISRPACCNSTSKRSCVALLWERDFSSIDSAAHLGKISLQPALTQSVQLTNTHLAQTMGQGFLPLVLDLQVQFPSTAAICVSAGREGVHQQWGHVPHYSTLTETFPALNFLHPCSQVSSTSISLFEPFWLTSRSHSIYV